MRLVAEGSKQAEEDDSTSEGIEIIKLKSGNYCKKFEDSKFGTERRKEE